MPLLAASSARIFPASATITMQFSIRWLLLFVAAAAAASMMFFVLPDPAAFWSLLVTTMAVPSLAIPVIVYSRDKVRAFAIGAVSSFGLTPFAFWFFPVVIIAGGPSNLFELGFPSNDPAEIQPWKIFFAAILGSSVFTGLSAIAIRHACLSDRRRNSELQP